MPQGGTSAAKPTHLMVSLRRQRRGAYTAAMVVIIPAAIAK